MKNFVLLCLFSFLSSNIYAKCGDNFFENDKNYKYFIGKGYSDKSAKDAMDKAEQDFNAQITRLFGVIMDSQSEFYSDEVSSAGTSRIKERSLGNIRIKGLEISDESQTTKENGSYIGYVCYKYPIKEYEKEKHRLENIKFNDNSNYSFNETEGNTDCIGSPLSITTNPGKALVIIDDGKYQGETPIKFGNICNGKHKLLIIKENYKDIQETLIIPSSKSINKTLKKDFKEIKITTSLGNSHIFINGKDYGKESVQLKAILGDNYEIEGRNDEAIPVKKTRIFYKDSPDTLLIQMEKKPASIDFSGFKKLNPGVRIYIDGEELKGNRKNSLQADYEYNLKFKKKDFYDIKDNITLKGGKTTYYPTKRLEFKKDTSLIAKYNEYVENSWLWVGMKGNIGSFKNKGFNTPIKSFGIESHIFLGERFSFDFEITSGLSDTTSEFGNISDRINNSTASYLFSQNTPYANFKVSQKFLQLYSGISLYLNKNPYINPFVSVGYNKILNLSHKLESYDSNFLSKEDIEKISKIETTEPIFSVGVQILNIFNITGKYSPNYYAISCGIIIPIKF